MGKSHSAAQLRGRHPGRPNSAVGFEAEGGYTAPHPARHPSREGPVLFAEGDPFPQPFGGSRPITAGSHTSSMPGHA
jgi:hypothetical protein